MSETDNLPSQAQSPEGAALHPRARQSSTQTSSREREPRNDRPPVRHERPRSTNQAYLQDWKAVPQAASDYVDALLEDYDAHTAYVFKHILICGQRAKDNARYVPVPARLIQRKKPDANLKRLVEDGRLEMVPHDRAAGRCAEYRVPNYIMSEYNRRARRGAEGPPVNLFTSKPTMRKRRSKITDENNNPLPQPVRAAMTTITKGYCNEVAVLAHLETLKSAHSDARRRRERLEIDGMQDSTEYKLAKRTESTALNRYTHDLACYLAMKTQKTQQISPSVFEYQVAYRMTMSGRLAQIGGGAQSASRLMKKKIYTGLEDVRNYDIKSSQVYVLIELLTEAGIDASWLQQYVDTPKAKHTYARKVNISTDAWKSILYALFMGAALPQDIEASEGDIRKTLMGEVDPNQLSTTYSQLYDVVAPLYNDALKPWRKHLIGPWLQENSYTGGPGGRVYVKNAVGVRFRVDDVPNPYELKKKLAAFLLQGREAAFIHKLTALSAQYDFQVISNEHDGLVTIGPIPDQAIERAKTTQDMPYVEFVEKDFC